MVEFMKFDLEHCQFMWQLRENEETLSYNKEKTNTHLYIYIYIYTVQTSGDANRLMRREWGPGKGYFTLGL